MGQGYVNHLGDESIDGKEEAGADEDGEGGGELLLVHEVVEAAVLVLERGNPDARVVELRMRSIISWVEGMMR